jgi:site-specific DNA-methyltransferase (adenine-specific)
VELLEYLVKTYTNDDETVLDNTMGSGTTGVACINTNRKFVGVELYENYFKIAIERCQIAYNERSTKTYTHLSNLF